MASDGSLMPRRPLHITVNSGSGGDLLESMGSGGSQSTGPGTPKFSRQLLPQQRPPAGKLSRRGDLGPYGLPAVSESSEMLLPPSTRTRNPRQYAEVPLESPSRAASAMSSRRTSWSSDAGSRDSRQSPFASPFDDSRAPSRAGSDDDNVNTQTVSEKYNIMPSAGLLLFPEDVEKDDWLHNPDPSDRDREKCDIFTKRGLVNVGGLVFITVGILVLFIGFPVLYDLALTLLASCVLANVAHRTFVRTVSGVPTSTCSSNPDCLSDKFPLLKNQRIGLIDPDTPQSAMTKKAHDGSTLKLVVCVCCDAVRLILLTLTVL